MLVSMLAALMLASPVALTEIINGYHRDNLLRGTARTDQIRGYGGNDKIQGEGARDRILGDGEGAQRLGPLHTHTVSLLRSECEGWGLTAPTLLLALIYPSAWRNCLEKRAGWVDDVRSRAWRSVIRPICLTMSGSVWSSSCRLPTSEDDRGPTAPARSLTPSSTS